MTGSYRLSIVLTAALTVLTPSFAHAALGDCGHPTSRGPTGPSATDSLFVLRAAVGAELCKPCVCDADASGAIAATDALAILRSAVGLGPALTCFAACDPLCGDGMIDAGEECDDAGESPTCDSDCTVAYCRDATLNTHGR